MAHRPTYADKQIKIQDLLHQLLYRLPTQNLDFQRRINGPEIKWRDVEDSILNAS